MLRSFKQGCHPVLWPGAGRKRPASPPPVRRRAAGAFSALLAGAVLAGCAAPAPPATPVPIELLHDQAFTPAAERVDGDDVFALSAEMRRFAHTELRKPMHAVQQELTPQNLVDALYRRELLKLEYDATGTSNAAQTFAARKGNCLSLVLMTAAFAKELHFLVTYQVVDAGEFWSRHDDIAFLSGHVNIDLSQRTVDRIGGFDPGASLVVDFLPGTELKGLRVHPISEDTLVAMYLNNRAAEALAQGTIDAAYWWVRSALQRAPDYSAPYNTLGVVYLRHGDLDAAAQVLRRVLARDGDNRQALSNLAIVVERQGLDGEARELRERLARLEPDPPYKFFFLGRQALQQGDFRAAHDYFAKEVARADYNGEFHYWLGLAELRLGRLVEARRQMQLAMASSTTAAARDVYAAKLERLRAVGVN